MSTLKFTAVDNSSRSYALIGLRRAPAGAGRGVVVVEVAVFPVAAIHPTLHPLQFARGPVEAHPGNALGRVELHDGLRVGLAAPGDHLTDASETRGFRLVSNQRVDLLLARRLKKVSKRAKRLAELDARQRHKLRIGIKKLRYAGDFFAGLFSGRKAQKRLRRFLRGLKGLQDRLGALNDIAVHERLAGRYVGTRRRRQRAFAIGLVSGREQTRVGPLRAAAASAAERFADLRPFWA